MKISKEMIQNNWKAKIEGIEYFKPAYTLLFCSYFYIINKWKSLDLTHLSLKS
jgi:hypothetical protein